ncbi:MAG: RHS repeat-associated core domain-containing protein [Treponema sp.]|nr:RHS repeat-associated core domain-containing protein [Treponema sp.]
MKDALYFWRENKEMKKQLRPETVKTDSETGLTYHWNRWRNEDGNAFISEDPLRDGYNWYGYANANPFKYADSNGLESYVCRDGTFCNEGDISNPSYRADCYHYNGYNAGTIASMSGPAYNLANNGGQATLSLAGTRADPGRNKSSPSAAEEIKNCGNVDIEKITLGKISDTVELLEVKAEVDERITIEILKEPESRIPELITTHVPLNQLDFDVEFGFGDGKPENSKSCKTVSLINAYADVYGVDRDSLRKTVEEWKNNNWIDKDGSPLDINKMSNSLAKSMGLKSHYEIPGIIIDGKWENLEVPLPFRVPYKLYNFGIVKQYSKKYKSVHYVYLSNKINGIIDSLDPYRDEAPTYTMIGIQPFVEYKNY